MEKRTRELDPETGYKVRVMVLSASSELVSPQECFRVFSKDQDGCITAEEMK